MLTSIFLLLFNWFSVISAVPLWPLYLSLHSSSICDFSDNNSNIIIKNSKQSIIKYSLNSAAISIAIAFAHLRPLSAVDHSRMSLTTATCTQRRANRAQQLRFESSNSQTLQASIYCKASDKRAAIRIYQHQMIASIMQ
jgi:hypothetical protein